MLVVALPIRLWAQAPPLAEVAKKEQDRRKATATAGKVYTNKDLPKAGVPATPAKPATPTAVAEPATQPTQEKAAGDEKDEAWWRARITQARTALERDRVMVTALESRVAALTTDVTNRDDPAQRAALMNERVRVLAELDRMRDQVAAGVKAIAAIEDDARKAGVPAGWIR